MYILRIYKGFYIRSHRQDPLELCFEGSFGTEEEAMRKASSYHPTYHGNNRETVYSYVLYQKVKGDYIRE